MTCLRFNRGMTLIDLLITLAILSIAMMAILSLSEVVIASIQNSKHALELMNLTREIDLLLLNETLCEIAFKVGGGANVSVTGANTSDNPAQVASILLGTTPIATSGSALNSVGPTIDFMERNVVPGSTPVNLGGTQTQYVVELSIGATKSGLGAQSSRLNFRFLVATDSAAGNQIVSCASAPQIRYYQVHNPAPGGIDFYSLDQERHQVFCDPGDHVISGGGGCVRCDGALGPCGQPLYDVASGPIEHPVNPGQQGWQFLCDIGNANPAFDTIHTDAIYLDLPPYRP